jgi:hypothetical protein
VALSSVGGMQSVVGPILNDLGVGASVVIVGGGVLGLYQTVSRIYNGTIGSRRDLARRLNQLAAGVTLRHVEERFGTPAFACTIILPRHPSIEGPTRPRRRPLGGLARFIPDAGRRAREQTSGHG